MQVEALSLELLVRMKQFALNYLLQLHSQFEWIYILRPPLSRHRQLAHLMPSASRSRRRRLQEKARRHLLIGFHACWIL